MKFGHPFLLLLIPAVLLLAWHYRKSVSAPEKKRYPLLVAAVSLMIVALSSPYWKTVPEQQWTKAVDVVVLLDVSQSMFCPDGDPRRIDQARNTLRVLLPDFGGSSVTVIYFAGDAQVGCPLTTDLPSVFMFLNSVTAGMTARAGTDVSGLKEALGEPTGASDNEIPASSKKVLLLFSDGEFFGGSPRELAGFIRSKLHSPVFAFLCGKNRSPVPTFDLSRAHPNAFSAPRPESMAALAESTSGHFFDLAKTPPAAVDREVMKQVGEALREGNMRPDYRPAPFLLMSLVLLLMYQVFPFLAPGLRLDRRPAVGGIGLLVPVLLVVTLGMATGDERKAAFERAMSLAGQKKYDESLKILQQLQSQGASEEIEVAIGNVQYARGDVDQAIGMYSRAVERNPMNPRARWNWEVALKQKEDRSKQPPPPPTPPPPASTPPPISPQADALLKYFDQMEQEQMRQSNPVRSNDDNFAW